MRILLSGSTLSLAAEWLPDPGVTLSRALVHTALLSIYVGGSDAALHKISLDNLVSMAFLLKQLWLFNPEIQL